jgi:transcriptional regulator with XRE-family HTH domain
MNTVERIKAICKERKIPISKLEKDCGFSNGYIGQLRKGTMQNDRMMIVSEYLNISMEELATGEKPEVPMIAWTPEHLEVVELFDKLNKEQKTAILTMMRTLALS